MKKAIFLDRDGVINENVKDLTKPEQFKLISGVGKAVKIINDSGYLAIIVTNQPIISKGFMTFDDLDNIHDKMKKELEKDHAHIDAIYTCPHHSERGFPGEITELKIDCDCRKPKPGLLIKAAKEHKIDLKNSWMIGDSMVDIGAGKNAGCKTCFITLGGGSGAKQEEKYKNAVPDLTEISLLNAIKRIIKENK